MYLLFCILNLVTKMYHMTIRKNIYLKQPWYSRFRTLFYSTSRIIWLTYFKCSLPLKLEEGYSNAFKPI